MIEIMKNLFVGNGMDYELDIKFQKGWAIVQAAKEPYHRKAVGYVKTNCDKNHPEYFFAYRDDRLILNLLDEHNPKLVPNIVIDTAIKFIDEKLAQDKRVFLHCNAGMSRSSSIGMLYLAHCNRFGNRDFFAAERIYRDIYPPYAPARGMYLYMLKNWKKYANSENK